MLIEVLLADPPRFLRMLNEEDTPVIYQAQFKNVGIFPWPEDSIVEVALNETYRMTQNLEDNWRGEDPCRSSSVGDLFKVTNHGAVTYYEIVNVGFKIVTFEEP